MNEQPESTTEPAAAEKPKKQATERIVLMLDGSGMWAELGLAVAVSQEKAIEAVLEGRPEKEGTFVAPPTRSWRPIPVSEELQSKLKFGG